MLGNSVVNPIFGHADHAQMAMLSGNSQAAELSHRAKKRREEEGQGSSMSSIVAVMNDGGSSMGTDVSFEQDAATFGPREEQMAVNMKIMQRQRMLCDFSTLKAEILKIITTLSKIQTGKAYGSLGDSDKKDLRIMEIIRTMEDQINEIDIAMKSLESISAAAQDSEEQFEPFRLKLHEWNHKKNLWT
eukprot:8633920-Karenia_brevis.AAC.1